MHDRLLYMDETLTFAIMQRGGEYVNDSQEAREKRARKCISALVDLDRDHEKHTDYLKSFLETFGRYLESPQACIDVKKFPFRIAEEGINNFFGTAVTCDDFGIVMIVPKDPQVYTVQITHSYFSDDGRTLYDVLDALLYVARLGSEALGAASGLPRGRFDRYAVFDPASLTMGEWAASDFESEEQLLLHGIDPSAPCDHPEVVAMEVVTSWTYILSKTLHEDLQAHAGVVVIPLRVEGGDVDARLYQPGRLSPKKLILDGTVEGQDGKAVPLSDLDAESLRRLAACALFQHVASLVLPSKITVDRASLTIKRSVPLSDLMAQMVNYVLDEPGEPKVRTCPWCGRPVVNRNGAYCKHGGCKMAYSRAAKAYASKHGVEAAAAMYPAIKAETMQGWQQGNADNA